MWCPDRSRLVKVRLHSRGLDPETPWAEDCGPAPAPPGGRYVRLGNVPFLHAKPTYEDVIAAAPDEDGALAWDDEGLPYEEICERLVEDSGRWVMILDYALLDRGGDVQRAFAALDAAGEDANIAVEGCYAPRGGKPGRAYLAAPAGVGVDDVLALLSAAELPLAFTLVHPLDEDEDAG